MKTAVATVAVALLAASAQAALQKTSSNGVNYHIVVTQDGQEIEAKPGPQLNVNSKGPQAVKPPSGKRATIQSTGNWCGLSNVNAPSGTTWTNVQGSWIVPTISLRSGQTDADQPSIAQWVGIDGDGCGTGLIQGGTVSQIESDGTQSNYAWWEFVPDALDSIQLTVNTGDTIWGNVTATSDTSGVVEIINYSSGQGLIVTITNGPGQLCGYSAEWILEDLSSGGSFVPFAEFPDNSFYGPVSTASNGESVVPSGADEVWLVANNEYVCEASFDSGDGDISINSTA